MEIDFLEEERYILAKKKVKKMKDFYSHAFWYVLVNIFLSAVIIFGLIKDNDNNLIEALSNFGVYSTWFFWGIGLFFHWLGVFGFKNFMSDKWEKNKIEEFMRKEKEKEERLNRF